MRLRKFYNKKIRNILLNKENFFFEKYIRVTQESKEVL